MLGNIPSFALYLVALALVYVGSCVVYRLTWHPLAHIPGPLLARVTGLYEWYYDLWLGGQFTFRLRSLHDQFGPVIRISPNEVHIYDPEYFEQVYSLKNGRVLKPTLSAEAFGPYPATIGTHDHDLHRLRRAALNPFFSRKSVEELVPGIRRVTQLLCDRLEEASKSGETVNQKYFFAAATLDIINEYCFSKEPQNVLKSDFGRKSFDDVDGFLAISLLNIHIPWIMRFTYSLPDWINKILAPNMADILDFREALSRQVEDIRHGKDRSHEKSKHKTVLHELLSSKLPPAELKRDRIRDEAFSLVTAGSGTTAYVLRGTAYHIAANPAVRKRLHEELQAALPDLRATPMLSELEALPYLTAVIQEGLRLCEPLAHRISRQFPEKDLVYHDTIIPAGAVVGMTTMLGHRDERIFPAPNGYDPERWLGAEKKDLERHLHPYGRGPRSCLGVNLARAELYLILAAVFRRFDFDVSQVDRARDIDASHDYIMGAQVAHSPGILVRARAA